MSMLSGYDEANIPFFGRFKVKIVQNAASNSGSKFIDTTLFTYRSPLLTIYLLAIRMEDPLYQAKI